MNDCVDQALLTEARAPLATYRLQMHAGFTFADAEKIVPYLKQLGVGDLYSSPILEARPGSMHGYDVTRHDRLNPELGGDEGFARLTAALKRSGMGLLLDIVPNHMGVGNDSVWWQDVLQNGRASEYANYFDIDWTPLKPDMQDKLLLPILGQQYGEVLESGELKIALDKDGRFRVRYYDHSMPVAPRSLPVLFENLDAAGQDGAASSSTDPAEKLPQDFSDLLRELAHIPPHATTDPNLAAQRREQLADLLPRLREQLRRPELASLIARALNRINGRPGEPRSFDRLHELLELQPYRLAFWRVSSEEINYRRFFDVNDLVGLRMENPQVFAGTHCLVRRLLARKDVTGLRIDHCDGLFNPRQYLIRLQLLYIASQCLGEVPSGETGPNGIETGLREALRGYDWAKTQGPLYCVVEKILEPRESLPREWPVRGTSGYDFVHFANQFFIQQQNRVRFNDLYAHLLGNALNPDDVIYQSKLQVMVNALSSETYVLSNLLGRIAAADRRARDFTDNLLEGAIRETIASFPVYRTYIDDRGQYTERDVQFIRQAIQRAKRRNQEIDATVFDFLESVLLLKGPEEIADQRLYFALKFQQLTGPVMAKGVEDTAFYVYTRFLSSNEVGSSMKAFGIDAELLHDANQERLHHSPDTMLTTSTHDTKRSEDVRNRLNVLSELPYQWGSAVRRWQRIYQRFKTTLEDGRTAPDANEEYLLYQTIVGAWPWQMESAEERRRFAERIKQYASKALSEAKVNLSWTSPNPDYLKAVHGFIDALLLKGPRGRETQFVSVLQTVLPVLQTFGALNSLAQVVLKVGSPGVPDFYQGSEMWDLSLVDPDNRRPVDYEVRTAALTHMQQRAAAEGERAVCADVLGSLSDGRVKLWVTHRALALRGRLGEVFRRGEYIPVAVEGTRSQHAFAFLRRLAGQSVLVVLPRFACPLMGARPPLPLGAAWEDTALVLPEGVRGVFKNVFTGERVNVRYDGRALMRHIFTVFPVAMLASE